MNGWNLLMRKEETMKDSFMMVRKMDGESWFSIKTRHSMKEILLMDRCKGKEFFTIANKNQPMMDVGWLINFTEKGLFTMKNLNYFVGLTIFEISMK